MTETKTSDLNLDVSKTEAEPRFRIRAFRSIDDEKAAFAFYHGHTQVLSDYGIENLNTAKPSWITDPNVYAIIAYDSENQVVGGLRVHVYSGQKEIPLIDALEELDPGIVELFEATLPQGTAEVCGLWNSKKVFGKGLSPTLCMASVAVAANLGIKNFFCFSAPYTEKMIKSNGCVLVESVGNGGKFHYPTEEFVSSVLFNPDVEKLEFADPYNFTRIKSLISQPHQISEELSPRGPFRVRFDLLDREV